MRATVTPAALAAALAVAGKATGKAATSPILPLVLIEAHADGGLAATGTDLRTRASHTVQAMVEAAGAVCLPPEALADYLGAIPGDVPVTLAVDATHRATLTAGRAVVRVAGIDPEQYPAGPEHDEAPAAELLLVPDVFKALVESVVHAAARDDTRPALAGVNFSTADGTLCLTAADGLRLARRTLMLDVPVPGIDVIVPAGPLAAVAAGLDGAQGHVRLAIDGMGKRLTIDASTGTWALLLLDGPYPRVAHMLGDGQAPAATYTVARADLLRACKLVSGVLVAITSVDGKTAQRVGKAVLAHGSDGLTVRAGDVSADHMAETVIACEAGGAPYEVALNTGALTQAAEALAGPVVLELGGAGKPVYLRDAGGQRMAHLHMIAPIAVSNAAQRA